MKIGPCFLLLFLFCLFPWPVESAPAEGGKLLLIAPGQEPPAIIVGSRATDPEKLAAQEIRDYLQKITGREINIRLDRRGAENPGKPYIAIGVNELTKEIDTQRLATEQYVIEVTPERLAIVGGRDRQRGVLYGVYDLLDQLGVRWYRPESWGEHVPKADRIELELGRKEAASPRYEYRSVIGGSFMRLAESTLGSRPGRLLWAVRNRLNGSDVGSDPAKGGQYRPVSSHIYYKRIPVEKYFDEHPEYFCLYQGERRRYRTGSSQRAGDPTGLQLCLSNKEVQELFAQSIINEAKQRKDLKNTSFSATPNDAGPFCECEECKAMDDPADPASMSNRVCAFTNIVAKKVARAMPGARVSLNTYSSWTKVPTVVKKMEPNVLIHIALINEWADYTKAFDAPAPNFNLAGKENLARWKELGVKRIYMYEYWSGYAWKGPLPIVRVIADRVKQYQAFNVQGIYNETSPSWGPQGLELYMSARLFWNPDLDVDAELELYYRNFYGPAAEPMKKYHEALMSAMARHPFSITSGGRGMHLLFTPALVDELGRYIEEARTRVENEPLYQRRLAGVEAGFKIARQVGDILVAKKAGGELRAMPSARLSHRTYYQSAEAEASYDKLLTYMRSLAGVGKDAVIDVSSKPPYVPYMRADILENQAMGFQGNEEKFLKPFER